MKWRSILSLSAVAALGLAFSGNVTAQQKSLKEQLVGTWSLVAYDSIASDGSKKAVFGAQPKGTLMLDANGHYAMLLTDSNRPKWKSNLRTQITTEDLAMAAKGLVAQFGTWSVDEKRSRSNSSERGPLRRWRSSARMELDSTHGAIMPKASSSLLPTVT